MVDIDHAAKVAHLGHEVVPDAGEARFLQAVFDFPAFLIATEEQLDHLTDEHKKIKRRIT